MVIFNSYVKLPEGMFAGKLLNLAASSEVCWFVDLMNKLDVQIPSLTYLVQPS